MAEKTMTLTCEAGHTWERPAQRGRPPRWCPEHTPAQNREKAPKAAALSSKTKAPAQTKQSGHRGLKGKPVDGTQHYSVTKHGDALVTEESGRILRIEGADGRFIRLYMEKPNGRRWTIWRVDGKEPRRVGEFSPDSYGDVDYRRHHAGWVGARYALVNELILPFQRERVRRDRFNRKVIRD